MAEVVSAWNGAVALAAGRWQVSWHDLANVLTERSAEELTSRQYGNPWPKDQVPSWREPQRCGEAGHHAHPRGGARPPNYSPDTSDAYGSDSD